LNRISIACGLILVIAVLSTISCSWSAKQLDILNTFNETVNYIDTHDWESAFSSMSTSTILYLDSLAADFTAKGLAGYSSGMDLLPVLCGEYADFSGDVTEFFIQTNLPGIPVKAETPRNFHMFLEEDQ